MLNKPQNILKKFVNKNIKTKISHALQRMNNLLFSNSFSSQELPDADDSSACVKPEPAEIPLKTLPDDELNIDSPELP